MGVHSHLWSYLAFERRVKYAQAHALSWYAYNISTKSKFLNSMCNTNATLSTHTIVCSTHVLLHVGKTHINRKLLTEVFSFYFILFSSLFFQIVHFIFMIWSISKIKTFSPACISRYFRMMQYLGLWITHTKYLV